jgi:DNA-binding CsgD family transcriptional regulator
MKTEIEKLQSDYIKLLESQKFIEEELDYSILDKYTKLFSYLDEIEASSYEIFDICKKKHICFSPKFGAMLGFTSDELKIDDEINYDDRIHPDDIVSLYKVGNYFFKMGLEIDKNEVTNFKLISDFRIRNKNEDYIRIIKQYIPIELDKRGNIWLSLGIINPSPDQDITKPHRSKLVNHATGEIFYFKEDTELNVIKSPLSERELQILEMISLGYSSKIIADKLFISTNTVNTHRQNIIEKLGVNNSFEAVSIAFENQWFMGKC